MTKRDVLSLALRTIGIMLLTQMLIYIPSWIISLFSYEQFAAHKQIKLPYGTFIAGVIVYETLMFILPLLLISKADYIASKMTPVDSLIPAYNTAGSGRAILAIATQIFGVYLLTIGIPDLTKALIRSIDIIRHGDTLTHAIFHWQNVAAMVAVLMGFLLLFGAKHLANLVYGREVVEQTQDLPETIQ